MTEMKHSSEICILEALMYRFSYEVRLLGKYVFLTPALILLGFASLAVLLARFGINPTHLLVAALEMFLSVAMGFIIATTCTRDPALEIQLTLPGMYAKTVFYRLFSVMGWSAGLAFLFT